MGLAWYTHCLLTLPLSLIEGSLDMTVRNRDSCKLDLFISCLRQFEFEQVIGELDCSQQFTFTLHFSHRMVFILEILLRSFDYDWHVQDLITSRSGCSIHLNQTLNHRAQLHGIMCGNRWILSFQHSLVQTTHIISSEWWHQCTCFIQNTA